MERGKADALGKSPLDLLPRRRQFGVAVGRCGGKAVFTAEETGGLRSEVDCDGRLEDVTFCMSAGRQLTKNKERGRPPTCERERERAVWVSRLRVGVRDEEGSHQ